MYLQYNHIYIYISNNIQFMNHFTTQKLIYLYQSHNLVARRKKWKIMKENKNKEERNLIEKKVKLYLYIRE